MESPKRTNGEFKLLQMVSEPDTGQCGEFKLLQMVSEPDTGRCASKDAGPKRG